MTAGRSRRIVALCATTRTSGAEVGFKAARLADVARLGLPVPEAFALTVGAFAEFRAANGIRRSEGPPAQLAERIRGGAFPAALAAELRARLAALPGDTFAVRSSALSEDGRACSMAGQLETFLDVRRQDVPEMVKACWAALFGPVVLAYAAKHGMKPSTEMGVIVQRQIHPRYAGVLFTLDPVTDSADHFVIEWVEGLGDALVSGTATPERIRVSRRSPVIPAGPAPDLARALAQLVAHAALVERHVGCPVDIEWCAEGTALFLLQARPITAAMARDAVVWTSANMSENFPKPLTPFAWSIVDEFYTRYVRSLTRMLGVRDPALETRHSPIRRLTGVQGGRVCYNIRSWYELLETYVPGGGGALRRGLDHYIGQHVPVPLDAGDRGTRARRAGPLAWIAFWSRLAIQLSRGRRCLARFERMFLAYRRALRQPSYDALTAPALMRRLDALFEDFVARHWHRQCIADFAVLVFPGLLDALLERWAAPAGGAAATGALSARLLRQPGTSGTEAAAIIGRMADGIGAHPDLAALLEARRYTELGDVMPEELRKLYADFMERFGSRCYHECMIVSPTFEERPDLFWDLVAKYRRAPRAVGTPRAVGRREPDPVDEALRGLPWGRRLVVRLVLDRARRAIALREQGRLVQSLLFGEVRRLALALGTQLAGLGHLAAAEDVFSLHTTELRDLCAGKFLFPETLPELIALRRRAHRRCEEREPPECFVIREGAYFRSIDPGAPRVGGSTLRGVGASGGRARGRARVILDPVTDRFEPGEILIARSTDPGWTALFAIAGALVLERGGILSHGAIVAREFGVPAVVGVEGITRRLRGGEEVSVDGDTGDVVILDAAAPAARRADGPTPRVEEIGARTRDCRIA
jgi:phosphohistidine swiveling domain-containing protein